MVRPGAGAAKKMGRGGGGSGTLVAIESGPIFNQAEGNMHAANEGRITPYRYLLRRRQSGASRSRRPSSWEGSPCRPGRGGTRTRSSRTACTSAETLPLGTCYDPDSDQTNGLYRNDIKKIKPQSLVHADFFTVQFKKIILESNYNVNFRFF